MEYKNLIDLARENHPKKFLVAQQYWKKGSWCIVNKIVVTASDKPNLVLGHVKNGGTTIHGLIPNADKNIWKVIKVLDDALEVEKQANGSN